MRKLLEIHNLFLLLSVAITFFVASNFNFGKDRWTDVIASDGKGYYAYLPAVFIYQDLNFGFFDEIEKEKYYEPSYYFDYRATANNSRINKYYCGTALAQLPFFGMAHAASKLFGYEADGYSKLYAVFLHIATVFYVALGLFFLKGLLQLYEIKKWVIGLVIIACVFGTNLFYYAEVEPSMSHAYSFGFVSWFVFLIKKYSIQKSPKQLLLLGFVFGMIVLIRPVNAMILLSVPFITGSKDSFLTMFRSLASSYKYTILSIVIVLLVFSLQLLYYKLATGSFFVYSYMDEGFNFLQPEFFNILFSYKKGLFLYTPMYLLAFGGLIVLWKRNKWQFSWFLIFFGVITYVLSSWWMWFYGGSFSSRVYVEYLPVFMLLLALGLNALQNKWVKSTSIGIICLLIIICQIQIFQYRYGQIHWSDQTKEMYWDNFLRIDKLL